MATPINKRAIPPPRELANRASVDALVTAVNELSGSVGVTAQRAVRVCELVDAGIMTLSGDGAIRLAGVVTLTGAQTVRGAKTFTDTLTAPVLVSYGPDARGLLLERTGSANNSVAEFKTTGGSVFAGQGTSGNFDIGSSADLSNSANRWARFNGTIATLVANLSAGGKAVLGPGASSPSDYLHISGSSGEQLAVRFAHGSTLRGLIGVAGTSGQIITNSDAGDICIRSETGVVRFGAGTATFGVFDSTRLVPVPASTVTLGSSGNRWGAMYGTTLDVTGDAVTGSNVYVGTAARIRSSGLHGILSVTGGGTIYLRPNGDASGVGQLTVTTGGTVEIDGIIRPATDNARALGAPANRWSVVYAGTGTINTSDARGKTPVTPMSESEVAAGLELSAAIGTFQWLDSVAQKGDAARMHVGLTVQRAIEIMQSRALDPMAYGFICHDAWEAEPEQVELVEATGEDGSSSVVEVVVVREARPAGDRYGFRHDQLLLFIAYAERTARERLEARVAALEGLLL